MCTLLDVQRSTFYVWRGRVETPTASRRRGLREQVRRVFDTSRQTYGCRRVAAQLNRDGIEVSVGTVAGIMRAGIVRGATTCVQADHDCRRGGGDPGPDRPGLHRTGSGRASGR
ncbi:IS3 family transposase [Rhodococcus qingshengii]|uniref:IS3 family transposase n=1 Tax=Rhodococcus qingshengii TaxID=334542 RepID=UPI00352C566A